MYKLIFSVHFKCLPKCITVQNTHQNTLRRLTQCVIQRIHPWWICFHTHGGFHDSFIFFVAVWIVSIQQHVVNSQPSTPHPRSRKAVCAHTSLMFLTSWAKLVLFNPAVPPDAPNTRCFFRTAVIFVWRSYRLKKTLFTNDLFEHYETPQGTAMPPGAKGHVIDRRKAIQRLVTLDSKS